MKITNFVFVLGLTITSGCHAASTSSGEEPKNFSLKLEGVVNGGGGKGVRCGNTVKSLDLYEGELSGYPRPLTSNDFEKDLKSNVLKWSKQIAGPNQNPDDPIFQQEVLKNAMNSLTEIIDIPSDQSLEFTNDATLPPLPNGCSFVQIAVNVVEQVSPTKIKIYRDEQLWNLMDPIEQTALILHEYIYSTTRLFGAETNSDETRVLVAKMLSDLETYSLFSPLRNNPSVLDCTFLRFDDDQGSGTISKFFAGTETENGVQGTAMYFFVLEGKIFTSRTRSFVPNLNIDTLINVSPVTLQFSALNVLHNKSWNIEISNLDKDLGLRVFNKDTGAYGRNTKGFCRKLK